MVPLTGLTPKDSRNLLLNLETRKLQERSAHETSSNDIRLISRILEELQVKAVWKSEFISAFGS